MPNMNESNHYTKKVIEHFLNPHNYGKLKNPDGIGKAGNLICGDVMHLYIKVGKNKEGEEIIKDVKFETFGCAAAISTSSVITDLVKEKTLKEAVKIDNKEIIESLGGLPSIKVHCSLLAVDALSEAVYDYLIKSNQPVPKSLKIKHARIKKEEKEMKKKWKK